MKFDLYKDGKEDKWDKLQSYWSDTRKRNPWCIDSGTDQRQMGLPSI